MSKKIERTYCSHCGDAVSEFIQMHLGGGANREVKEHKMYKILPFDTGTIPAGEPGELCMECVVDLEESAKESPSYPEHEKLSEVKHESQAIGEFIEWATCVAGYEFAKYHGDDLQVALVSIEGLLAEYFGVDLDKLEAEKRAMLEVARGEQ